MKKFNLKRKFHLFKILLIVTTVVFFGASSSYFLSQDISSKLQSSQGVITDYLYQNIIDKEKYLFFAENECYILVEIDDIDFSFFKIDGVEYELSYGLNKIRINFQEGLSGYPEDTHLIEIENDQLAYFKSLTVEPLVLAEGNIEDLSSESTNINFQGGGLISFLLQPNFSYNELYVKLDSEEIKKVYPNSDYDEINSQFYSYYVEGGAYTRFDANVKPGQHNLELKGDGKLKYKIVINLDWDEDQLSDVEEFQYELFYDLDPTIPDTWGFFEKSPDAPSSYKYGEEVNLTGRFTFYLPETAIENELVMDVYNGEFFDFSVDRDSTMARKNIVLSGEPPDNYYYYGIINPGWHYITFSYKANLYSNISFRMFPFYPIKVINSPESIDSDGDGIKDNVELSNGLNIYNQDTDEDGIPDNYDSSPLSSLVLDKKKIHQFILPVTPNKNIMINMQIKRPEMDYSTGSTPRLWRNSLNVSIYPALRLFEKNRYRDQLIPGIRTLGDYWGKSVKTHTLVSPSTYSGSGFGDGHPNPGDDDYMLYIPKSAINSFEFDINFPKDHSADNDGFLDIRFDIIWLVTHYDSETKKTNVLHYYEFEENIIVQSMTKREITDVNYILGTPDSFIENQILWALTQNPALGTPEDFNVANDIIGKDTVDYLKLADETMLDLEEYNNLNPTLPNENQVLYVAGMTNNYDILNKLYLKQYPELPYETKNQGDYSMFYSYYSINNVYEDEEYTLGDEELLNEEKILYIISKKKFTQDQETTVKVANLLGKPIYMEVKNEADSKILKISNALGYEVPLEKIPNTRDDILFDKISYHNQTYIEKNDVAGTIPTLNFNKETDIYKEFFDNRYKEVEQGQLFFNKYSDSYSYRFNSFTMNYMTFFNLVRDILDYFDLDNPSLLEAYEDQIFNILREYNEKINNILGSDQSYSQFLESTEISTETKLKSFEKINRLLTFLPEDVKAVLNSISKSNPIYQDFKEKANIIFSSVDNIYKLRISIVRNVVEINQADPLPKFFEKIKNIYETIEGAVSIARGAIDFVFNTLERFQFIYDIEEYEGKELEFAFQAAGAIAETFLEALELADDIVEYAMDIAEKLDKVTDSLEKASKFIGKAIVVVQIALFVFQLGTLVAQQQSGDISDYEFTFQLVKLAVNFAVSVGVGLALGAAFSSTGIGIGIGIAISIASLISGWLTDLLNDPDFEILTDDDPDLSPTRFFIPMDLIRRQGSLRQGDQIHFRLVGKNTGNTKIWFVSKFRLNDQAWTPWHGRWGNSGNPGVYYPSQEAQLDFYYDIPLATPDVNFQLWYKLDALITEYWFFIPVDHRVEGADKVTDKSSIGLWALDKNINKFHKATIPLKSVGLAQIQELIPKFEDARDNYRYKDAYNIANDIIKRAEEQAGLSRNEYNSIAERSIHIQNQPYHLLKTSSEAEFKDLIERFFDDDHALRALNPIVVYWILLFGYIPFPIFVEERYGNLIAYAESDGYIKIPNGWFTAKDNILQYADDFEDEIENLPIRTNIRIPFEGTLQDIDPITGILELSFNFDLVGPANQRDTLVDIEIIPPAEFTVTPNTFSQKLSDPINCMISRVDQGVLSKDYNFKYIVRLTDGRIIYERVIPFYLGQYRNLQFEPVEITEPVNPGDMITLLKIVNYGNIPELVELEIKEIPEEFIFKDMYPEPFNGRIQQFVVAPGETREAFIINPPRHYSVAPGFYEFNVTARESYLGYLFSWYADTIEIAVFYDTTFEWINPEISFYDYETPTYNFEVTNLGNVIQDYTVSYSGVSFATSEISTDSFQLAPGETQSFNIKFYPDDLGFEDFTISVESANVYHEITCSLEVIDDDTADPYFENIIISDDCNWVNIDFRGLDELLGDDEGISLIEIYVDDQLISFDTPDPSETDFTFNLINQWIWEVTNEYYNDGQITHEIRVLIVDADDDRDGDSLSNEFIRFFEVTLDEMYDYVIWLLEEINKYIYDNNLVALYGTVTQKLVRVQGLLTEAYQLIVAGELHTGLVRNKIAEAKLEIAESKAELKALKDQVGEPHVSIILSMIHNVRNKIVELMGRSIGTEFSHEISLTEVDLYNLRDLIEDNIDETDRESLFNIIALVAAKLEDAIFDISLNKDTEGSLMQALHALNHAKVEVKSLYKKGKILEDLKEELLIEICKIQAKIIKLINDI